MALFDTLASRLARPAGRVLDAPIRDIVHELLKEHGYASPAEVQGLRDELHDLRVRVDSLDRRVADLSKAADEARAEAAAARKEAAARPAPVAPAAPDPRVATLEARVAELEAALAARVAELTAALAARPAAPAPAAAPAPEAKPAPDAAPAPEAKVAAPEAHAAEPAEPLSAAARGSCKVPECPEAVRSKGFCSAHYQQWRRGTLKSFVNADGTALVEGRVVHLPSDAIGGLVSARDGRLYVDGKPVNELPA